MKLMKHIESRDFSRVVRFAHAVFCRRHLLPYVGNIGTVCTNDITNGTICNQRTIGPENAHLKPDPGVLSHHEMTLTLNTHTPLLNS